MRRLTRTELAPWPRTVAAPLITNGKAERHQNWTLTHTHTHTPWQSWQEAGAGLPWGGGKIGSRWGRRREPKGGFNCRLVEEVWKVRSIIQRQLFSDLFVYVAVSLVISIRKKINLTLVANFIFITCHNFFFPESQSCSLRPVSLRVKALIKDGVIKHVYLRGNKLTSLRVFMFINNLQILSQN